MKRCIKFGHTVGHSGQKRLTFPSFLPLEYAQLVLSTCRDLVVLSFLRRGASAFSGKIKKVKEYFNTRKISNKEGREGVWKELRGRTEWNLLNAKLSFWSYTGLEEVGTGERDRERDLHSQSLFISSISDMFIRMLISFCLPSNAFLSFIYIFCR